MYKIISKKILAKDVYLMDVEAPRVAENAKPGQFIILKIDEKDERIPLTITDFNKERGIVTIVFQAVGASTKKLSLYEAGEYIMDFVGPLGKPSEFIYESIENLRNRKFIFVAGGVGTAPIYAQVNWLHKMGIDVDVIIGARTKNLIIMEEEMKKVAGNVYICTDDGTYGMCGKVTDCLLSLINIENKKYDKAIVVGPMIMMKFMCILTKKLNISTIVSLNSIMVDGTGMCGACRVNVGGEMKFTCVDGPEFNGHLLDFDECIRRQSIYKEQEHEKMQRFERSGRHKTCSCGGGIYE